MDVLSTIISDKQLEVVQRKQSMPAALLKQREEFHQPCVSLKSSLLRENATGIIAEFKRKSPSKGWINEHAAVSDIVVAYKTSGATGISVLTDEKYFGGSLGDLAEANLATDGPILRKDFIIDEYQLIESKAWGADVVLLIAANLSQHQVEELSIAAHRLGLEVLLEIHDEFELGHICESVDIVGVNNRNLKSFEVDINTSVRLSSLMPAEKVKISESGIQSVEDILILRDHGFEGFLIGELFMKEEDPAIAFSEFVNALKLAPPKAEGF